MQQFSERDLSVCCVCPCCRCVVVVTYWSASSQAAGDIVADGLQSFFRCETCALRCGLDNVGEVCVVFRREPAGNRVSFRSVCKQTRLGVMQHYSAISAVSFDGFFNEKRPRRGYVVYASTRHEWCKRGALASVRRWWICKCSGGFSGENEMRLCKYIVMATCFFVPPRGTARVAREMFYEYLLARNFSAPAAAAAAAAGFSREYSLAIPCIAIFSRECRIDLVASARCSLVVLLCRTECFGANGWVAV